MKKHNGLDNGQKISKLLTLLKHVNLFLLLKHIPGICFQGFLAQEHQEEALSKLQKRIGACSESFCRQLESFDKLSLSESHVEVKEKRKTVVSRIQVCLCYF